MMEKGKLRHEIGKKPERDGGVAEGGGGRAWEMAEGRGKQ